MRKLFVCTFVILCLSANMTAQTTKDVRKERQEMRKVSKSELNEKASKAARKDAKKLTKEGWITAPGALPLEKQLDKSYMMQMEYDDDMYPKYLMGEAMSIGENYDAAKMQALELAKQNLAGQIQTEVTALIENSVANQQLAWGIALLAGYLVNNEEKLSLADYLDKKVFAGNTGVEIAPTAEDVAGFDQYIETYKAGLAIEKAAVENKK